MWSACTVEYFSALKKKFRTTWKNFEGVMLRKGSQTHKKQVLPDSTRSSGIHRDRKLEWWLPGLGEGRMESCFLGTKSKFCKMKKSRRFVA